MSGIIAQNSGRHTGLVKASSGGGVWNLIKTYTASGDSDLSFGDGTDGVDFTAYDEFVFKFINIHNNTDANSFSCNFSTDNGSNYNVTKTTSNFIAYHVESGAFEGLSYSTDGDLAQSTSDQPLLAGSGMGSDADQNLGGELNLFAPSDTTFVKHFLIRTSVVSDSDLVINTNIAGYCNTTSAVDAIQFKMSSGNFDGTIKMWGVK